MTEDTRKMARRHLSRRNVTRLGVAASAATFLANRPGFGGDEVRLGAIVALTGPNSAWGQRTWRGFQLACDMVNKSGGLRSLGGARIRSLVGDTESRPEIAASETEKLIRQGVSAIIGTNQSAATIVATQIAERSRVPFITSTDVDPLITGRGFKYVFRTLPLIGSYADDLLGHVRRIAQAAGDNPTRLAILSENSIVGQSSVKAGREVAKRYGFELVEVATYDAAQMQNFASYIAKYKGANIEVLVGHNKPNDAILITRTMKELNFNPKAYGGMLGGHISSEYVNSLGADANNVLCSTSWSGNLKIAGLPEIAEAYHQRYDEAMDSTAAAGVSSLSVLWDALERAGKSDGPSLREAIAATDITTGDRMFLQLRGAKFDERGENVKAGGLIYQIENQHFIIVAPEQYAEAKTVYPKPNWS